MYIIFESLCCVPEINIILYVNHTLKYKEKTKKYFKKLLQSLFSTIFCTESFLSW